MEGRSVVSLMNCKQATIAQTRVPPPFLCAARRLTRDEKRDVAYREGARYLRQHLGIDTQTELTRVLDMAMNPNSLFADRQTNKMRAGNASVSPNPTPPSKWDLTIVYFHQVRQ